MDKEIVKALSNLLDEKLDSIIIRFDEKLEPIKIKLDEHTQILREFKQDFKTINTKLDEHTQILRALEHSAEVNKAEQDKMSNDIAHIKGDVEGIKKDLLQVEIVTSNNWNDIAKLKAVR